MKRIKTEKKDNRRLLFIICGLIMLIPSVLVPLLLKLHTRVQYSSIYSDYTIGQIAETNVYAKESIDLIDRDATDQKIEEARKAVKPVFSYSMTYTRTLLGKADLIREAVASGDKETLTLLLGSDMASRLLALDRLSILSAAYDILNEILETGYFVQHELEEVVDEGYSSVTLGNRYDEETGSFDREIVLDSTEFLVDANIREFIATRLYSGVSGLTAQEAFLLEDLIYALVDYNVFYDRTMTEQRRLKAESSVDSVVISVRKGQLLIEADHVVNNEQVELLRMLSTQSNNFSIPETIGHLIFDIAIIVIGLWVFDVFLGPRNLHYRAYLSLLTTGYVLSLVATYFLSLSASKLNLEFGDSFLPVFFLPLFMTEVTGYKRIGFVSSFMISAFMATLPTTSIMTFFFCVICGSSSVFFIRFFNRRLDVVYQWFFSSLACSAITLLFMFITQTSFNIVFTVLLGTLINVATAYVVMAAMLPLSEKLFNLPTIFRLYELAYGESPILSRLSQAAPGTYSHSMAVADLAEVGARAIGANPLLARVGGLYHDIGKIEHPEYFVENQSGGVNKHDEISPSLSVAIIKSHVKIGAEKGREAGLPLEIVKTIANHHGNDIIQYFYHEAMKLQAASNDDRGETVKASDFSYNAEIPDFRECGIVMLADSIEAASRTVIPNASKYAKLIDSIFMGKIERGQLDNSGLTLNDIKTLSETFVKALVARNHSRIEYPDDDDK
jgi:hypothetical protein